MSVDATLSPAAMTALKCQFDSRVHTDLFCLFELALDGKGMRAASVGPHVGEGDLFRSSTLQQELAGSRIKEEDGESTVQETLVDVGHEMAFLLASVAEILVVVVEDDASLLHKTNLLLIVTSKRRIKGDGRRLSWLSDRRGDGSRR